MTVPPVTVKIPNRKGGRTAFVAAWSDLGMAESRNGNAAKAPTPCRNVRRLTCFIDELLLTAVAKGLHFTSSIIQYRLDDAGMGNSSRLLK